MPQKALPNTLNIPSSKLCFNIFLTFRLKYLPRREEIFSLAFIVHYLPMQQCPGYSKDIFNL